jgi:hypothetical protein
VPGGFSDEVPSIAIAAILGLDLAFLDRKLLYLVDCDAFVGEAYR